MGSPESHDDHEKESDHEIKVAGPNGGKIMEILDPHFEFFITKEKKVQITFLNEHGETIQPSSQLFSLIAGSGSRRTKLKFEKLGNVLISNEVLPKGNRIPVILNIQASPGSKKILKNIQLSLRECTSCSYKRYACVCGGHDH